jgi:hypothetical protein
MRAEDIAPIRPQSMCSPSRNDTMHTNTIDSQKPATRKREVPTHSYAKTNARVRRFALAKTSADKKWKLGFMERQPTILRGTFKFAHHAFLRTDPIAVCQAVWPWR